MAHVLHPWPVVAAVFAGLTAFWGLSPAPRLGRSRSEEDRAVVGPLERLVRGRPDATSTASRALVGALAGLACGVLLVRFTASSWGWLATPLAAAGLAVLLGWLEPAESRRRRHRLVLQTPQALELLAACLVAGLPVRRAAAAVVEAFDGPVAEDLGRVTQLTALGTGDAEAWTSLAGHPQLGPAAADLARSVESGTLLVEGLRHHARRAREQRQAALQVMARSVGVRSVLPMMCCFIPSFVLLGVVPTVASALTNALHL